MKLVSANNSMVFTIIVLLISNNFFKPLTPDVQACLPRIAGIWPSFGRKTSKDGETGDPFDKQTKERVKWTTNDWIEKHKYPLELHQITTKDGYRLQMQRLPKPGARTRPVLLVHGLLTSSLSWVLMGPGKSLAFLLFERNYDVWLANLRGSAYACNHTQLNVASEDFWNFSFHEHGAFDLPALIDHICKETSFEEVVLIGHSQAFNAFLAMCSLHPEYNERVAFVQALAPIAKLKKFVNFNSSDVRVVRRYLKKKRKSQDYQFLSSADLNSQCLTGSSKNKLAECLRLFEVFAGVGQHSRSLDPFLFGQLIQGGSLKEINHLHQIWQSGDFVSFDYGPVDNRRFYNTVEPFNYNLGLVRTPIVLHFGETDAFGSPRGVHSIYSRLLPTDVIRGLYRVDADKFNHFDFLISSDVKKLINDKIIDIMEKFLAGTLKYVIE